MKIENFSVDIFHQVMAQAFDLMFAVAYERRFNQFGDMPLQTSPYAIAKLSQSIAALTDPTAWKDIGTRYQSYVISSMRRAHIFSCFRNYSLALKCLDDVLTLSKRGFAAISEVIEMARDLFVESGEDGLDLEWCNTTIINELIEWLIQMINNEEAQQQLQVYISHLQTIFQGMSSNKSLLMLELDEIDEVINN